MKSFDPKEAINDGGLDLDAKKNNKRKYVCQICQKRFSRVADFLHHYQDAHTDESRHQAFRAA